MKKILLIALFAIVCYNAFALISLSQDNWRWRKDNGTEQTATWLAEASTRITISSYDSIRLRILIKNGESLETVTLIDSLQYATAINGAWKSITATNMDNDFILEGYSSHVTDGEPTTAQLSYNSGFIAGKIVITSDVLKAQIGNNQHSEYEWGIRPTVHLQSNMHYYFRMSGIDPGADAASLITAVVLPINLTGFIVTAEGKFVKIVWVTASELNNDHFEIERSADGKTQWQVIALVKGNGPTEQTHTYTAYDKTPLDGKNFYRIKQFDTDGKWKESAIRYVLMHGIKPLLTVYPNPAKKYISFTLSNYNGIISFALTDLNGKIIHTETISAGSNSSRYALNLKNPLTPGVYVLQWKGEGFEGNSKVFIQ